jgi:hypothetical protein
MMRATIDRIESPFAVLITQEDESVRFTLPLSLLPAGSREGDIVVIGIERDIEATIAARERVSGRIEKLKNRENREFL